MPKRIVVPEHDKDRFWRLVERLPNGCWIWMGGKYNGYGCFQVKGVNYRAHRLAYELIRGGIPDGLHLDHLCRNRSCVNPDHLEPVTQKENNNRGMSPSGHSMHDAYVHSVTGKRWCSACRYETRRRLHLQKNPTAARKGQYAHKSA